MTDAKKTVGRLELKTSPAFTLAGSSKHRHEKTCGYVNAGSSGMDGIVWWRASAQTHMLARYLVQATTQPPATHDPRQSLRQPATQVTTAQVLSTSMGG